MSQTLQLILGIVALTGAIGGFLIWHFKEMHRLKDQLQALKIEMKDLEIGMKDLEKRDDLQQLTIDQLKELYPLLKVTIENLNQENK